MLQIGDIIKDCNKGRGYIVDIDYDIHKKPSYYKIQWFVLPTNFKTDISWMPHNYVKKVA